VGRCDRGDDRQPEPGAAELARPRALGPVEALEDPLGVLRGDARAVVLDLENGVVPIGVDAHADRRAGGRVHPCVRQQVVGELPQTPLVAEHRHGVARLEVDRAVGLGRAGTVDRGARDGGEVDRLALERTALVQTREQIEVIKGQMKYYEQSAAMSAVSVELIPNEAVQPLSIGGWQPVGVAKDAIQSLIDTLKVIANIFIWVLIFVVPVLLVLFILFVLPLILIFRALRRRRARRNEAAALEKTAE